MTKSFEIGVIFALHDHDSCRPFSRTCLRSIFHGLVHAELDIARSEKKRSSAQKPHSRLRRYASTSRSFLEDHRHRLSKQRLLLLLCPVGIGMAWHGNAPAASTRAWVSRGREGQQGGSTK